MGNLKGDYQHAFMHRRLRLRLTRFACATTFLWSSQICLAQIISHQPAPHSQQAQVIAPERGAPVVHIVSPNNQGVSHNQFQQFNIGREGAILSNNAAQATTQLHGAIAGNPHLANGKAANIIINEVVSTQYSRLNGPIEVAGQKAAIVISNPNGITIDGMSTINASRTTLTTGRPVFGGSGSLDHLRVTGGQITFTGNGLKDLGATQTDIIARNISINARVWGERLHAITGNNTVNYNTLKVKAINGTEKNAVVALDIAELGGMYANKIHLIGTESGVGVKDYGEVSLFAEDFQVGDNGQIETNIERPSRIKRNTDTPPPDSGNKSSSDDDNFPEMPRPPINDTDLSDVSISSVDSTILASLQGQTTSSDTLPVLTDNDLQAQLPANKRQKIDVTPMPLVGGPFGIIPSPQPGAPLGITPSTSGAPYIGVTRFPDAQSPQPGPSTQVHPPVRPSNKWYIHMPFNQSQHKQWYVVPGKRDTMPLGIIPVFNPYSKNVGFYFPPNLRVVRITPHTTTPTLPIAQANVTPTNSTLITSHHTVQHAYRYWDTSNYLDIFHQSPTILHYLNHFGDDSQVNPARTREIMMLMNIAQGNINEARRLLATPIGSGIITATSDFHGQTLETVFDNAQQRITGLRLIPIRSGSPGTVSPKPKDEF